MAGGRTLTAGMLTSIASGAVEVVHLVELQFSGGTTRLCSAAVDLDWDSQTWIALGEIALDPVRESIDNREGQLGITFDDVDETIVAVMLASNYIGHTAKVWRAHVDVALGTVIADPVQLGTWFMNGRWEVSDNENDAQVRTTLISEMVKFDSVSGITASVAGHQRYVPGDTFFNHITVVVRERDQASDDLWNDFTNGDPQVPGGGRF